MQEVLVTEVSMRSVPLAALSFSKAPAQVERRAHLDKAKLAELASSIKAHGLVQPILVRPTNGGDTFEVVAGERRAIAAKQAGLEVISATVRELTDEQVYELQLIENLQRQDLHELAEAEGYEALAKLGHSVDDMAAKVGKSKATVYARMKLLELTPDGRKAYYAGKISASVALVLARVPVPDVQNEALKIILAGRGWGPDKGPMSYREALEYVQENCMTRLKDAPFSTVDGDLVPAAGPCSGCPKNTASATHPGNLELFADVEGARGGVCTDPVCFKTKREAWSARAIERARETGQKTITGKDAEKITRHGLHSLQGGYVRLTDHCYDDSKQRTYKQILGKDVTPTLLETEKGVIEVVRREDAIARLPKRDRDRDDGGSYRKAQAARERKAKEERAFRRALFDQVLARLQVKPSKGVELLRRIARGYIREMQQDTRKLLCGVYGWTPVKKQYSTDWDAPMKAAIAKMSEAEASMFLDACTLVRDLEVSPYSSSPATELLAAAKACKVDPAKVRKELAAAAKAPAKHK